MITGIEIMGGRPRSMEDGGERENTELPEEHHPLMSTYRHITVKEIDGVVVVRFIDLKRELRKMGSFPETCQEFGMLASRHEKCLVVLDLEGQEITASELFICYLVRLDREIKQVQGMLKLCNLAPQFAEELRMIRLDRMFSIYESLEDALVGGASTPKS
jgi:hypothetical protein